MKMWITIIIMMAPILAFGQNQGLIHGHVTEGITGEPVPGITISLRDKQGFKPFLPPPPSDKSDETGYFQLKYVRIGGEYIVDAEQVFEFKAGKVKHTLTATKVEILSDKTVVNFRFSKEVALDYLNGEPDAAIEKKRAMKRLLTKISRDGSNEDIEELHQLQKSLIFEKYGISGENGKFVPMFSFFEIIE